MAYEQPRVPIWRGESLSEYIRTLVRFLRGFTMDAWNADRRKDEKLRELEERVKKLEGGA